ncbi:hypothetical protein DFH06DRAFT_152675 [Mycena polygramma]|nr:hypothetical protein DFH06DRAFT_152675 [Mycena polygramma]
MLSCRTRWCSPHLHHYPPKPTNFGNSAPCFCARRRVLEARATARCSIWITPSTAPTRKCRRLEPTSLSVVWEGVWPQQRSCSRASSMLAQERRRNSGGSHTARGSRRLAARVVLGIDLEAPGAAASVKEEEILVGADLQGNEEASAWSMCARRKYDVCASPWSSWLVIQRKGLAVSRTGTRDGGRELGKDSKNLRYGHGKSSTEEGGDTVWLRVGDSGRRKPFGDVRLDNAGREREKIHMKSIPTKAHNGESEGDVDLKLRVPTPQAGLRSYFRGIVQHDEYHPS